VTAARLVGHQLRYDLLSALRNPQSRFFTLALPVIFLVIFSSVFGDSTTHLHGHLIKNSTYYVPGIATLGVVAVSFVNLVITVVVMRESGVLKRRRSTPVPAWVLIAGRAITAVILAAVIVAILLVIGRVAYGVRVRTEAIPGLVLTVGVGAACFCCISYAVASFIHSEDSAQPIIQAVVLPLYFISGVFIPKAQLSSTLRDVGNIFPIGHLNEALFKAFDPTATGAGIAGSDLLILAVWGVAGLLVGLRRFSWAPQGV
jgi:ABC-2 type transport system permease protein